MIVKARGSFLKVTPNKARQIMDLIRGKDVNSALATLNNINKRPVVYIKKILNSAISWRRSWSSASEASASTSRTAAMSP